MQAVSHYDPPHISSNSLPMLPTTTVLEPPKIQSVIIQLEETPLSNETNSPSPKTHLVIEGETLTKLSELYSVPLDRLWSANPQLSHPDVLNVNEQLNIPANTDVLSPRPLPTPPPTQTAVKQPVRSSNKASGGGYSFGYCTEYAWSKRPDLPGNLGNANTWDERARAQGFTVNSSPSVGAIGVAKSYTHVVYVEKVDGDRVYVSEKNYKGWNVISSRWTSVSEFVYIH